MRNKGLLLLLIGIIFLLSSPARAADKEKQGFETFSLGEIFLKGDKPPVVQETAITTVISAEEIKGPTARPLPRR